MAVRRLTRRESKRARANWAAVRAAGEKVLLEWLFGFEQCDVPALNRAELDEIRHNLGRFGAVRDGVVLPAEVLPGSKRHPTPRLSRQALIDIQTQVRELLTHVRPPEQSKPTPPTSLRIQVRTTEVLLVGFDSGQIDSVHLAPWPDRLWLAIIALLKKHWENIMRCGSRSGSGQCGRLFFRSKRQEFCSKRCSQRERARRWYEKNRPHALRRRRVARLKTGQ